jgi:hypothetical protein
VAVEAQRAAVLDYLNVGRSSLVDEADIEVAG